MTSVQIGQIQTMPSEGGQWIAVKEDKIAIAGRGRLCIWENQKKRWTFDSPTPSPGTPRFADDKVYWGPGFADLKTGAYTVLDIAKPVTRPGGGEIPYIYQWSVDGRQLVGIFGSADQAYPVRVSLFNSDTLAIISLWREQGIPPGSAWLGEKTIVVGFGNPRVSDRSGKHITDIMIDASAINVIQSSLNEKRMVILDLNRNMFLIDTSTWTILDRWPGPWIHGAISPDGQFAAVLEPSGKIHFASLEADCFRQVGEKIVESLAVSIMITTNKIFIIGSGEFHQADLKIDSEGYSANSS